MVTEKQGLAGFDGYAKLSLLDADRKVRDVLAGRLSDLKAKVHECSQKARSEGREKLLSEIDTIERRLSRLRDMTAFHEGSYIPPYTKQGISRIDTKSLNDIDGRLETLIEDAYGMISDLSCAEKDLNIIAKLSAISGILRNYESELNARSILLKQELKH
jgi:hypothetical protein